MSHQYVYVMKNLTKVLPGGRELFRGITLSFIPGAKIGVLGVNGAGKSTQLRIIAGLEEPSSGQVVRQGDPRIVFLQQEFDVDVRRTVREELFQAFGEAAEVRNRQGHVEQAMASERAAEDPDYLQELIEELGRLQTRFEGLHGYELDARIDKLLPTIGFTAEGAERQVKDYSGGWQMRIALGKILLQDPDLLLLDEPTAGLDLGGREDLLTRLAAMAQDPGAPTVVMVTHHVEEIPSGTTHALLLKEGVSIAAGPVSQALTDEVLTQTYGIGIHIESRSDRWTARAADHAYRG